MEALLLASMLMNMAVSGHASSEVYVDVSGSGA